MDNIRKKRIIIADDEFSVRSMIRMVLKSINGEIVGEAKNGQEAVEQFREKKPDLLLLDINMPVKNGLDALKEIIADFPDAFVIMLTSISDMETVEKCLDLGAINYIIKDTPIPEMKKIIKETWDTFEREGENSNG